MKFRLEEHRSWLGAMLIGLLGLPLGAVVVRRFGYSWGILGAVLGFLAVTLLAAAVSSILRDAGIRSQAVPVGRTGYLQAILIMVAGPVLTIVAMLVAGIIAAAQGMTDEETPWVGLLVMMFLGPPATLTSFILGLAVAVRTFRRRRSVQGAP